MSDDDRDSAASEGGMSDNDYDDNDDADSDGAMDIAVADEAKEAEEEDKAECLSPAELIKAQLDAISEVNTIFQISAGTARILLEHFNWDKERLLERYYGGDQEKLFREANVINPESAQKPSQAGAESKLLTCEICYVDFLRKEMTGLECGHKFCEGCWNQYLQLKIMDEGTNTIRCPALGCNILVDELTVTRLITTPSVLKKYEYLAAKAFVRDNRHIKWCPAPGCENAIRLAIVDARPVSCKCSHQFCFACLQNAHTPLKCKVLAKWLKKCADDSETSNWMAANTKECPKCKSTIEKNGGCNHMTCKNSGCRYEFCWVCLGAWEPHGSSWYNCNRFDEKDSVDARDAQKKSRDSLERYLHYYNRFANHGQSRQLEKQLTKLVERKQSEMQAANHSWIEVQFLNTALQVLQECRNTLRYTYVFAYYLRKNNQGEIFESNQKDLEMATETLSGYLEGDASADGFAALRRNVMDKTKYCETRRKLLVQHVEEGYANGWWEYSVDMD